MYKAMPTMPVSALRNKQGTIMAKLQDTPVLLTHSGQGAGVLLHPNKYNELIELVEHLTDLAVIRQRINEMTTDPGMNVSKNDVEKELIKRGLLDA